MAERQQVTQRASLDEVADLLSRPARAAVAFHGPDGPECLPVAVDGCDPIRIGFSPQQAPALDQVARVVLLLDDGSFWFELRAAVWRGRAEAVVDAGRGRWGLVWFELEPRRTAAWDYGHLRPVPE